MPTPTLPGIFAALSDTTRFTIVDRLLREGELSVAELREGAEISAPAVSRHLNVLLDSGLVTRRARAQQRLYSIRPEAIGRISAWTLDHREIWETGLNRLESLLLTQKEEE